MAPYFNVESGEMRDADLYTDAADPIAPSSDAPKPVTPKDTAASPTPALKPGWPVLDTLEKIERFRSEFMGNVYHPAHGDPELMDYYATAQWRLSGQGEGDPEVLGELFAGGQIRPIGADALSPAPRPTLPEGHAWDEEALVAAEAEAHAYGLPPDLVMTSTDRLREAVEQAEARGVTWGPVDGTAPSWCAATAATAPSRRQTTPGSPTR